MATREELEKRLANKSSRAKSKTYTKAELEARLDARLEARQKAQVTVQKKLPGVPESHGMHPIVPEKSIVAVGNKPAGVLGTAWYRSHLSAIDSAKAEAEKKQAEVVSNIQRQTLHENIEHSDELYAKKIPLLKDKHKGDYLWETVFGDVGFTDVDNTDYHTWDIYKNLPDTVGEHEGPHALSKEKIAKWEAEGYSAEDIGESLRLFSQNSADRDNIYNDIYVNKHLTDREKYAFATIWEEKGRDAAEKFLNLLRNTAAYREGVSRRTDIGHNILNELLFDIKYGAAESLRGIERAGSTTREKAASPDAYVSSMIYDDAAYSGGKEIFGKNLEQWVHRGATTVGGMLPSMAAEAVPGGVGKIGRAAMIFASSYGNGVQQAINGGATPQQAQFYGISTGLAEATLDSIFGSVGKLGGSVFSNLTGDVLEKASKAIFKASPLLANLMKWGGKFIGKNLGEVIEEYSQYLLDPTLQNLIYDAGNKIEPFSDEALETVVLSAMLATFFDGFGVGSAIEVFRDNAKLKAELSKNGLSNTEINEAISELRKIVPYNTMSNSAVKEMFEKPTFQTRNTFSSAGQAAFDIAMENATDKDAAAREFRIKYLEGERGKAFEVDTESELTSVMQEAAYKYGAEAAKAEKGFRAIASSYGEAGKAEKGFRAIASSYGEAGKAAYEAIISGSRSVSSSDFMEMHNAYTAGLSGISMPKAKTLSDADIRTLYKAGQKDAKTSLNAEKGAVGNRVVRKDAGLTQDAYTAKMNKSTVEQLDSVLKALGLKGMFVDSVKGGKANAEIRSDGTILLAKDMENPIRTVIGHEITHRMQELAPKEYRAFRDAVMKELGESRDGRIVSMLLRYKQEGVDLNSEAAMDEIAADYAGMLMEDGKLLDEFIERHKENRTLLERFLDAVRAVIAKLTGADKARLQTVESKLVKALEASAKVAEKNAGKTKNTTDSGVRYEIKTDENGRRYVQLDREFSLEGTDPELWEKQVFDYINEKIRNGEDILLTSEDGHLILLTERSAYKLSDRHIPKIGKAADKYLTNEEYALKARIASHIDEVVEVARFDNWREDVGGKHENDIGEDGFNYFEAWVQVPEDKGYYRVTFSSALYESEETMYSIAKPRKRGTIGRRGSSGDAGAQSDQGASTTVYTTESKKSQEKSSAAIALEKFFQKNPEMAESLGIEADAETDSVAPSGRFSLKTWNDSDYVTARNTAAKEIAEAIGVSQRKARDYIDSVNSIAKLIADDIDRLDYTSSDGVSVFVSNAEYGGSIDMSTLCPKRAIMSGTFSAIQKALPNTALTAAEILEIRKKMADKGLEVSCGCCYVEGSRAAMGGFAKEFINLYSKYYPSRWIPNMVDVNTPDGVERMRIEHPEAYEQYEYFWNHYGTLREGDKKLFASQQKPKLFQARTAYNGDILKHFSKESAVTEKNKNGGLRIQSFSDFEIVHLIDMMQVIMDMSRVGLAGQAYTKVPDFAWALGDTGLKINLSLISKGLDENGNLIFDPREGMSIEDAMELRERYSQNVGTILVVFSNAELKAAMADDRVDFIIPFHRSQWKKSQYATLGLPAYTKDYTNQQNEKLIKKTYHEYRGRMVPDKAKNFVPSDYWDYNKSGKENAEAYLNLCAKNNKRPKFYKLLVDNGNGTYSLQPDGSTDGYWKLLIDYKMYDNDGIGSPQKPVRTIFNMQESERMLNEYKGGHSQFPVAYDIVDEFVAQYKAEHPNTKYSLKGKDMYQAEYEAVMREASEKGLSTEEVKERIRGVNEKVLNALVKEYGAIKPGERPSRAVTLPKKTSESKKVSQTVRTVMEAEATPDEMIPTIEQMVAEGEFSYETITDKEAMAAAEAEITKNGFKETLTSWYQRVGNNKEISKHNTALGFALYNAAANAGDVQEAIKILDALAQHQRAAAQALQATRILKKMSPLADLYYAEMSIEKLQGILEKRYKKEFGEKGRKLKIDTELAEKVINGKNETEKREAMEEIYRDIGRQIPSTFVDKWTAWRYLAMLGNVRTHVRNLLGNTAFAIVTMPKNAIATLGEMVFIRDKSKRTKAFVSKTFSKSDAALLEAASLDYNNVKGSDEDGGKYTDSLFVNKYVEEGRRIFKSKTLEALRRGNNYLLDAEDAIFARMHYARALAGFCKARGITAQQIQSGKGIQAARDYAMQEALKATFRDRNKVSDAIVRLGRSSKGVSLVADAALPYRRTPANILVRGLEYGPVGLVYNAAADTYHANKGEPVTAAQVMDHLASGLTGSAILGLGIWLAFEGIVRGIGGDDEKEKEFKELMGHQQYALEIGDISVTLDWLAPAALPFFVGVNLAEMMKKDGLTLAETTTAFMQVTEPILEMSCLQSITQLLDRGFTEDAVLQTAIDLTTSYLTQAIPTLAGQIERTWENERMTTYTDRSNKYISPDIQYAIGKASAKIPGVDYSQIPYIDAWGRTEPSGSGGERAFNNMLNPSYTSTVSESPMEKELLRLYKQTGESVLPSRADKSFPIDGEQVYLTAEQYQKYATSKGKRSYRILTALTKSDAYNSFDDFTKAEVVSKVYTYSNAIAKSGCGAKNSEGNGYALDGWVSKAYDACTKYGIDEAIYIAAYVVAGNAGKYVNDGETVDNSPGLCTMQTVYAIPGLSQEQYDAMFVNFGVGSKVRGYDKKTVESKIAEFNKKYERIEG